MEHLKFLECNDCIAATVKKSHFAKTDVFVFQDFLIVPLNLKSVGVIQSEAKNLQVFNALCPAPREQLHYQLGISSARNTCDRLQDTISLTINDS